MGVKNIREYEENRMKLHEQQVQKKLQLSQSENRISQDIETRKIDSENKRKQIDKITENRESSPPSLATGVTANNKYSLIK